MREVVDRRRRSGPRRPGGSASGAGRRWGRARCGGGPRRPRRCSTGRRGGSSPPRASRAPPARARRGSSPPVEKRLTISLAGSTSSSGIGARPVAEPSRPRSMPRARVLLVDAAGELLVGLGSRRLGSRTDALEAGDRRRVPHVALAVAAPARRSRPGAAARRGRRPAGRSSTCSGSDGRAARARRGRGARSPRSASVAEPDPADPRRGAGEVARRSARGRGRPPRRSARRSRRGASRCPSSRAPSAGPCTIAAITARAASSGARPSASSARPCEAADRLEHQVRVDRAGAVADQRREVVDLARLAGLDDQAAAQARALADQVLVDGAEARAARGSAPARSPTRGR